MTDERGRDTSPGGRAERRDAEEAREPYPADPGQALEPEPQPADDAFAEPDHWVGGRHRSRAT